MVPKRKLVLVEWLDHCSHGDDWRTAKTIPTKPARNASVGWVLGEDKETVTIAPHFADADEDGGQVFGSLTILKRVITSRKAL